MTNRLAGEKSPYLQQHADNPVDWYPWGSEALERAKRENRPLLVSIGYSSCHWCHVMAHESFEDPETAAVMNRSFVNVKVDREERPDVDAIYMEAVQAMTGHGGWPLNVFITPSGEPFFGGTYFPPETRHGLPSWRSVIEGVAAAYRERPEDVARSASELTSYIRTSQVLKDSGEEPEAHVLRSAYEAMVSQMDWQHGGFGGAPKFPQPLGIEFVLRMYRRFGDEQALRFVEETLTAMAGGGIYDQVGGGFHRYSVDAGWVVPHFEKMLYDNALLALVYVHAHQITGKYVYRQVAEQTLDYLLRDMRSTEGGFYSALDADSEGEEGLYYTWTPDELAESLSPEQARAATLRFGVTQSGNFEGRTILTIAASLEDVAAGMTLSVDQARMLVDEARSLLLRTRDRRVPPGSDTKIITAWNSLAVRAFAEAGAVFNRRDYIAAAREAASFLLRSVRRGEGLARSYQNGPSDIPGFLEDYAYLAEALIVLSETAPDPSYLSEADRLLDEIVARFPDDVNGAFHDAEDLPDLVIRPRSFFDNPIPSGNSSAAMAMLRFEALTGETGRHAQATAAFRVMGDVVSRAPTAFSYLLSALDFSLSTPLQIAVVGEPGDVATEKMLREVYCRYLPNAVVVAGPSETSPLLIGRDAPPGGATAYVCSHFTCNVPAHDPAALAAQLAAAEQPADSANSSPGS